MVRCSLVLQLPLGRYAVPVQGRANPPSHPVLHPTHAMRSRAMVATWCAIMSCGERGLVHAVPG